MSTGPVMTDATSSVAVNVAASSTTSSGMACSSQTAPSGPCSPHPAACAAADSPCLAVAPQNGAPVFGLRMTQLTMTAPSIFAAGVVQSTLAGAAMPDVPACNLEGTGTFSWLLQFDTGAGTLVTGGAAPLSSPTGAYSFVNELIDQGQKSFLVQPLTLKAPFAGCSVESGAGDVTLPLYLDAAGTQVLLLPLHQLHFGAGAVSGDHSCIGVYNAAGLDPASSCVPDSTHPAFFDGASFDAYFILQEADGVDISALNESLCVLLSGNPTQYGTTAPGSSETVCKRDASGNVVFQGDWCSGTDAAASGTCADAVRFQGTFSASGVNIQ